MPIRLAVGAGILLWAVLLGVGFRAATYLVGAIVPLLYVLITVDAEYLVKPLGISGTLAIDGLVLCAVALLIVRISSMGRSDAHRSPAPGV